MPTLPYVPEAYDYGPTSRIAEMMLRAAQQQAQARYANSENLGRGIANAGQAIGDVLQQRQASQQEAAKQAEMGRRDGEWVAYLESGQWQADPQGALVKAIRTWGPDEGRKQFAAINDAMKIGQGNQAEDEKRLRNIASRVMKMGDPAVARMWPVIAPLAKRVYPEIQLGEQYDPQMRPTLEAFADAEDVAQVDTVDDAGNPVTRFVPKQAGASYAKPRPEPKLDSRGFEARIADAVARGDMAAAESLRQEAGRLATVTRAPKTPDTPEELTLSPEGVVLSSYGTKQKNEARRQAMERGLPVFENVTAQAKGVTLAGIAAEARELNGLLADPEVRGAIGPVSGRWTGFKGSIVDLPPKVQRAMQLMVSLSDTELRKRSGAQINDKEMQRLLRFTTDPTKPLGHNTTAVNGLLQSASRDYQALSGVSLGNETAQGAPMQVGRFTVEVE